MLSEAANRIRAERALEAYQRDDQLGPTDRRDAGFELFVQGLLEMLASAPGLTSVGLSVDSTVRLIEDNDAPSISILQTVRIVSEGEGKPIEDAQAFYVECFPRNTVLKGSFSIKRDDMWVERYFLAAQAHDHALCLAVVAVLCRAAAEAFAPATLSLHVRAA
jgi:hypothetical protein